MKNTKSKVTSIRVDPELYEKFKEVVEVEGKQVSTVLSEMMEKHVERVAKSQKYNMECDERFKAIFRKYHLNGEIEFEKIANYSYAETSGTHFPSFSFANGIAQQQIARHEFNPAKTKTFIENFENFEGVKVTGILLIEEK